MQTSIDPQPISGIHHITAICSSAAQNLDFYANTLGLQLVKKTVNFDDPFTYHLYYGNAAGRPGTILTFFPWADLPRGVAGAGMVAAIAFETAVENLADWQRHLSARGIRVDTGSRFGQPLIRFKDPDGLPLELIGCEAASPGCTAALKPPAGITGFHSASILLNHVDATTAIVTDGMGMKHLRQEGNRVRFAMQDHRAPGHLLDLIVDASAGEGRSGVGTVHHIAFRTPDDRQQLAWQQRLRQRGLAVSDVRDRNYFQSIYFREPGGVLFEIATDPPGFAVDEHPDRLGSDLKLPVQYESLRKRIEAQLPPLASAA